MRTEAEIELRKNEFLNRYNPERSEYLALTSGVKAAVQHNALYSPDANRESIKAFWKEELKKLGIKYRTVQTEETFIQDVEVLKAKMNKCFPNSFKNTSRKQLDREFRISHAQKSISVYLKHLWCMGKIVTPPLCPIDRIVLNELNANDPRWGYVNDIETYKGHINLIKEWRRNNDEHSDDPIAVWELFAF